MSRSSRNRLTISLALALLVTLTACSRKEGVPAASPASVLGEGFMGSQEAGAADMAKAKQAAAPSRRYIALSHQLVVDSSATNLQKVYDAATQRCLQAGCEILNASLQRETSYAPPNATLSVRMPPQAVDAFLAGFNGDAEVVQHSRNAEDKTDAVIDTEARLNNLTQLRDRLRSMLASRSGSIKDVIEIERQLADTQSQLDSYSGLRKALANETEKVALHIQFRTRPGVAERSFFGPVISAWHEAGHVIMTSLGGLITFCAALLPWLLIIVPAGWGVRRLWRKWRASR
ncbi:MAG: DUF4349 domain-containing protein [Rhodocyclaceae bacterium]